MLKKGMGFVFFTTLQAVSGGAFVLVFLRDGACFIWRENAVRRWAFVSFENALGMIQRYIAHLVLTIRYRERYRDITLPMKAYYKTLMGKKKDKDRRP
ncbi:MAG: hypothetical protein JXQ30_00280 [Spirochaetes bacterium]|nr:hypothetical protein [Spirochaetota bacterium]